MRKSVIYLTRSYCHSDARVVHTTEEAGVIFDIVYCDQCQLAFTNPYPSEETVGYLYEGRNDVCNFDHIHGSIVDWLKDYFSKHRLLSLVSSTNRINVGRVLDFGTGNGRYAIISSELFPSSIVDAVDYQREPPALLTGKKMNYYYENDFWKTKSRFDLIILRHVLEHNHHPDQLLRRLCERLTENGILYIEVPNYHSWYSQKTKKWNNSLSVPYHLYHFTAHSLRVLVNESGMDCEIRFVEMPLMGGVVQALLHMERSLLTQLVGIALHPVELILSFIFGRPCIEAICRRKLGNIEHNKQVNQQK